MPRSDISGIVSSGGARGNSLRGSGCSFIFPRKKKGMLRREEFRSALAWGEGCGEVTWNGVFALVLELGGKDAVAERAWVSR